eukprot:COSAG02_NODE_3932_length_6026_cov_5.753838_1_plen_76_part_00
MKSISQKLGETQCSNATSHRIVSRGHCECMTVPGARAGGPYARAAYRYVRASDISPCLSVGYVSMLPQGRRLMDG